MDAIELLKKDHETVKSLLTRLSDTSERAVETRKKLLKKIELELQVHTAIEEKIFYPALKAAGSKDEVVLMAEAKEEHRAVDSLVLPDIKNTSPASMEFSGRVKVLKELLEHHIEEEESEMFPKATQLLGQQNLLELGSKMEDLQKTLKHDLQAAAA